MDRVHGNTSWTPGNFYFDSAKKDHRVNFDSTNGGNRSPHVLALSTGGNSNLLSKKYKGVFSKDNFF